MIADHSSLPHYRPYEDLQGLILASAQAALGLHLLRAAGLMTGGTAGLALILQDRYGIRAGVTQIVHDAALFALAFALLPATNVAWSMLGALVLNGVIALNHRRDWYVVT
jgi:Uncharacterized conserved protein